MHNSQALSYVGHASTYCRTKYYRGIWSHTLPSAYGSYSGQIGTWSDSCIWYGLTDPLPEADLTDSCISGTKKFGY